MLCLNRPCPQPQTPSARICTGVPSGRSLAPSLDRGPCQASPALRAQERRKPHTPLFPCSQPLCLLQTAPPRVWPLGSTATAKGLGGGGRCPGEVQHKGCSLPRQLAPVKGPDENKRVGRRSTDGGRRLGHSAGLHHRGFVLRPALIASTRPGPTGS